MGKSSACCEIIGALSIFTKIPLTLSEFRI